MTSNSFRNRALSILRQEVIHPAASGGGYGSNGEVIYTTHPTGCPSVLVDSREGAKAVYMSNGSVEFIARDSDNIETHILRGHFDTVEKRETGMPSQDIWLRLDGLERGFQLASLVNPSRNLNLEPEKIKLVKTASPVRTFWYTHAFAPSVNVSIQSALALSLVITPGGPALLRQCFISNVGERDVAGQLWSFFNLMGTQRFVYNKALWYDRGLPLKPEEIVVAATVPFTSALQVKRVSARASSNLNSVEATCDAFRFIGDSAATSQFPQAVREGKLLPSARAASDFNRFSSPTLAASRRKFLLEPGEDMILEESLLFVTGLEPLRRFADEMASEGTGFQEIAAAYSTAAGNLLTTTAAAARCAEILETAHASAAPEPAFQVSIPADPTAAHYLNAIWMGVPELYENCRAHGARLADGIEIGTRDRAQDMWPMLKCDPARVRADLLHALSFLYRTVEGPIPAGERRLTRREKMHGMFPRQYPERWLDRSVPVRNDNRPYNDSAIWLADALLRYLRETGDLTILAEQILTVCLTAPETPESSAVVGHGDGMQVWETLLEIFACYRRQALDSPYGLIQAMYGDWADPVDMFGTSRVGDMTTRGDGRGAVVRLSCHVFCSLTGAIETMDQCGFAAPRWLQEVPELQQFALRLRSSILHWAWESEGQFVDAIHELRADGTVPNYNIGERGYTLGSSRTTDEFDGVARVVLTSCAWGLALLQTEAPWLPRLPERPAMIASLLANVDRRCFSPVNGLALFSPPVANNIAAKRFIGRLGMLPPGCSENGEYHHAQVMMHLFRLGVPGQAGEAWTQLSCVLSCSRGSDLCGPFDQSSNSYSCDSADPHYGAGMNFGLTGSMDWIFEFLEALVGLRLAFHDPAQPDLRFDVQLPPQFRGRFSLNRMLHVADGRGGFRAIPFRLIVAPSQGGNGGGITLNGEPLSRPEIDNLKLHDRIDLFIHQGNNSAAGCSPQQDAPN